MISLSDKIYGLSLLSWLFIIIILAFLIWRFFLSDNKKSNIPEGAIEGGDEDYESVSSANSTAEPFVDTDNKIKVYNFNTSWCGWSVKFQSEWDKFSDAVKSDSNLNNVDAFDVKCDKPENEAVCKEFEVEGFPTVIIEAGGRRGLYKGPRTSMDLVSTLKDITGN
jgi:hypothetical protein